MLFLLELKFFINWLAVMHFSPLPVTSNQWPATSYQLAAVSILDPPKGTNTVSPYKALYFGSKHLFNARMNNRTDLTIERLFIYHPSFISQLLNLTNWMVTIFTPHGVTLQTSHSSNGYIQAWLAWLKATHNSTSGSTPSYSVPVDCKISSYILSLPALVSEP